MNDTTNHFIALVDGSEYSESVCDHTAWFAHRASASVSVVHLISRHHPEGEGNNRSGSIGLGARTALLAELAELDTQRAKLAQQRGRAILVDAQERIARAGIAQVTTRLRHGEVVETLQEMESDASLILIGKRGEEHRADSPMLGSNLERAIRATKKPLLVASRAFREPKRFLLAFDGGPSALKAIDFIAERPHYADLECHLVSAGTSDAARQRQLEGAAAVLRKAGFTVVADHVEGTPEQVLSQEVEKREVELVVMGAYGHSRIRNFIIGSTTTEMIRSCKLPILLFR